MQARLSASVPIARLGILMGLDGVQQNAFQGQNHFYPQRGGGREGGGQAVRDLPGQADGAGAGA